MEKKHKRPEDIDENNSNASWMKTEEDVPPKFDPALLNDPPKPDCPKLRAGWDDCEISDSAWERFVQVRKNRSQKEI